MRDVALTPGLRLSSFPCWEKATASDAVYMRWVAVNVLQPVINRWGPLHLTSWKWWKSEGCNRARTGDHADAGTVDFVPAEASIEDVWQWMGANLRGRWGSLIHERDHIHVTRSGVGTRTGRDEFLREPIEGQYAAAMPGIPTMGLAALTLAGFLFLTRTRGRTT